MHAQMVREGRAQARRNASAFLGRDSKRKSRSCRISQLLTGEGGGSALWLDSLILNNLAVVLAPVLVGVGVLVLPASIIHMQLTA